MSIGKAIGVFLIRLTGIVYMAMLFIIAAAGAVAVVRAESPADAVIGLVMVIAGGVFFVRDVKLFPDFWRNAKKLVD